MRIHYFSAVSFPSKTANSIHIVKMCNALAALGHEVTLFGYKTDKHLSSQVIHNYYETNSNFKIILFKKYPLPYFERFFGFIFALNSFFSKVDLVFGRNINGCFFACYLGLTTIFESHAPIKFSGKVSEYLFRRMIRSKWFLAFVSITNSLTKVYEDEYPGLKNRIITLPDGADEVKGYCQNQIMKENPGKFKVGYAGHLYPGKGMEVISVLSSITPQDVIFDIVGGNVKDIEHWKSFSKSPNITFHGFVEHNKVKDYIKEFQVVLLPNQKIVKSNAGVDIGSWTSPLKMFEYMAQGKAIIASDIPVLKEVLIDGHNALLVQSDDIEAWGKAILKLKDNPSLRESLGMNAKLDFESKYTWKKRAERLINFIK